MTETHKERRRRHKAKKWHYVKCPDFVRFDAGSGAMVAILCKVCGTVIAGLTEETTRRSHDRAGNMIETKRVQFARFNNYAEVKIEFKDGSAHVTNICTVCLTSSIEDHELQELYEADIHVDGAGYTEKLIARKAKRIAALARNTGGIV